MIKSRGAAGLRSARRYAGESALFRGHVVCGPTSSLRVVIGADGRGRVDLTREGMGCVYGRTATRWRIASGLVAGGGAATAQQRNPVRVKVAADGVVEHVVSDSYGDNVKPMARVCRGVAGPRCAESMLRERGASNQWRCGRPYAAAGTRPRWVAMIGNKPTRVGLAVVIAHTVR